MNRLEFKNVIDVLGINNKTSYIISQYGTVEDVYDWNGLEIYFYGHYYSIIKGKIPFEVAQKIYDKYPNNPPSIRIINGNNYYTPIDWVKNDDYDKFIPIIFKTLKKEKQNYENISQVYKNIKQEVITTYPNNFYIDTYHIDTKEGLLILLTELQDYFISKNLENPNSCSLINRQKELLVEVNKKLIKQSNPYLDTNQWIKKQNPILEETKNHQSNDKQDLEIKELLTEFDKTVNPFINDKFDMVDPSNYIDNISFSCNINNNQTELEIKDKKTKFKSEYIRNDNRLLYNFIYGKKPNIAISHHYTKTHNHTQPKEVISIYHDYDDYNNNRNISLEYNLTNNFLKYKNYSDNHKQPSTYEQKATLIYELKKAIQMAEIVTINNMCVQKGTDNIKKV